MRGDHLPQMIDGFKRNEAFAGIKPSIGARQSNTANAGHRRMKTMDHSNARLGTAGFGPDSNYAR